MKVNLFVSRDVEEPYADIHTDELTDNITKAMSILENEDSNDMFAVKKRFGYYSFRIWGDIHVSRGG
ncbi:MULTISPECIES: hypothetical protein [unclassified Methanobrevibacter]|uniref:hypothetical protein n=1 Tax=unclassified Methanobrevibacter TaxID=2638681 RepID=UPI0027342556|nr:MULTISPECIES: hypothetical protein [unclassified Methanobrevibacter]